METTNKLKDINEVLDFLYQEFPQCFKQKDGIQPLKVGIFKDIAERIEGSEKVSKTQVRQALRKYTSNWRYLEAVTKSEFRIDLDGNQDEKVEQEHVEHAQKALEESRAKMAKRKKQQRPRKDGDTPWSGDQFSGEENVSVRSIYRFERRERVGQSDKPLGFFRRAK